MGMIYEYSLEEQRILFPEKFNSTSSENENTIENTSSDKEEK